MATQPQHMVYAALCIPHIVIKTTKDMKNAV